MGQRGRRWGRAAQQQGRAKPEEKPGPGSLSGRGALLGRGGHGGSRGRRVPGPRNAGREERGDHSWGSPPDTDASDQLPKGRHLLGLAHPQGKGWESCGSQSEEDRGVPPCCRRLNPSAFLGQERWHCVTLALVQDGVLRSQRPAHWWWAGPSGPPLVGDLGELFQGLHSSWAAPARGNCCSVLGRAPGCQSCDSHAGLAAWGLPRPQKPEPF